MTTSKVGRDGLTAYQRKVRRAEREERDMERCGRCGYARINVVHETDREHAPEGLSYYSDIPFCEFLPTGERVR